MKKEEIIREKITIEDTFDQYYKKRDKGVKIFLTPNQVKKLLENE